DLAMHARRYGRTLFVENLDGKPRHRRADGAEYAGRVECGDAGGFRHAVAFAQWRAEALLEGAPDIARTTTAPGGANLVVTIARTLWLLEEDLQHTTEIVDLRRAAVAHLIPETTGAEALHHGQFDVA